MFWYPEARVNKAVLTAGSFIGPVTIGVLHTTEGTNFTPSSSSYYGHTSYPHFTIELTTGGHVYQHIPIDTAARALVNRSGGVETNREGCIQIEIVQFAANAPIWSSGESVGVQRLRKLMRWIERNTKIPKKCSVRFGASEQYGLNNQYEISNSAWESYQGWLGHQHVPENSHWDPGKVNISNLLLGDDMPLTDADVGKIADGLLQDDQFTKSLYSRLLWQTSIGVDDPNDDTIGRVQKSVGTVLRQVWQRTQKNAADNDEILAQLQGLNAKIEQLGKGFGGGTG